MALFQEARDSTCFAKVLRISGIIDRYAATVIKLCPAQHFTRFVLPSLAAHISRPVTQWRLYVIYLEQRNHGARTVNIISSSTEKLILEGGLNEAEAATSYYAAYTPRPLSSTPSFFVVRTKHQSRNSGTSKLHKCRRRWIKAPPSADLFLRSWVFVESEGI